MQHQALTIVVVISWQEQKSKTEICIDFADLPGIPGDCESQAFVECFGCLIVIRWDERFEIFDCSHDVYIDA